MDAIKKDNKKGAMKKKGKKRYVINGYNKLIYGQSPCPIRQRGHHYTSWESKQGTQD